MEFLRKHRAQGRKEELGTKGRPKQGDPSSLPPVGLDITASLLPPNPSEANIWTAAGRGLVYQRKAHLHPARGHLTCEARQGPLRGEVQRLSLCKEEPASGLTCGRAAHKNYSIVGRYWRKRSYTPVETFSQGMCFYQSPNRQDDNSISLLLPPSPWI